MVPRNVRSYLSVLFAFCALITLSMLLFLPLVADVQTTAAAPAQSVRNPTLVVSPTNLTNCQHCIVNVIYRNSNTPLYWVAFSHGVSGVKLYPSSGWLQPYQQVTINILFPSNVTCPASETINVVGVENSVNVYWHCFPTSTPTPAAPPPTPTPPPPDPVAPTPSLTATSAVSSTPDPGLTPTVTSTPVGGITQQSHGNPPTNTGNGAGNAGNAGSTANVGSAGNAGSSVFSILLSVGALLLGLCAFTLYLIPSANTSLRTRLLTLILPASFLKGPPPRP